MGAPDVLISLGVRCAEAIAPHDIIGCIDFGIVIKVTTEGSQQRVGQNKVRSEATVQIISRYTKSHGQVELVRHDAGFDIVEVEHKIIEEADCGSNAGRCGIH